MLVLHLRLSGQQVGGRRPGILQGSFVHRQGDLEQQEVNRDVLPSQTLVDKVCARFNICQTIVFK